MKYAWQAIEIYWLKDKFNIYIRLKKINAIDSTLCFIKIWHNKDQALQ